MSDMKLTFVAPRRVAILIAFLSVSVVRAGDDDPFADSNRVGVPVAKSEDDPFADSNRAGTQPATEPRDVRPTPPSEEVPRAIAKPDRGLKQTSPRKPPATLDRLEFAISVSPDKVKPGDVVHVTLTGTPKPGFHTYPLTRRTANQEPATLSRLFPPTDVPGVKPLWPVKESEAETVDEGAPVGVVLEHKKPFTWTQEVLVLPDAKPGPRELTYKVTVQACNEKNCKPGDYFLDGRFEVVAGNPVPLSEELKTRAEAGPPPVSIVGGPSEPGSRGGTDNSGLIAFILSGIAWGAISLITPCVFPMIPITVSLFLKQSEKQHHRPFVMASVYSGTIIVVLTLGGLLLMGSFQRVSQHWATNLVLGLLFLFFALSLFGMYEIRLPAALGNFTSAREGKGGLVGIIFMALTFTIISFTCVAPFYGSFIALGASAQTAADKLRLFLGALAFSTTFASPFFVLALFPSLLRSMPKSGGWMNTVKVVMGFLEIAAALKFLRAGELIWAGKAEFFTYDLVLGAYVGLAILCGLYLLNFYRLPHDYEPIEQLGVPRMLFALAFLTLGFYLLPGLFKQGESDRQKPGGTVFAWLDSFLLPEAPSHLPWLGSLDRGVQQANLEKKLIFIDFTGLG
jgi:thiol:disulfide interchange protein DsbD